MSDKAIYLCEFGDSAQDPFMISTPTCSSSLVVLLVEEEFAQLHVTLYDYYFGTKHYYAGSTKDGFKYIPACFPSGTTVNIVVT